MPSKIPLADVPSLTEIKENWQQIKPWLIETPLLNCPSEILKNRVGKNIEILYKLELLQKGGSFKARGALSTVRCLDTTALKNGVVAASAGNHAVAVSYAAQVFHTSAKVIMPKTASPIRIQRCKNYGAEVILVESIVEAIAMMPQIAATEGRTAIHPYEGKKILLGTGSIGLELVQQLQGQSIDMVIVPVGGGGLCAGIALVVKQLLPHCKVIGIEPEGADSIYRSLASHTPVTIGQAHTIADSLGVPGASPYTFGVFEQFVDEVVLVSDQQLVDAMRLLFYEMKLALEPAAAATTAALCGPLQKRAAGKKIVAIVSGSNIDIERFYNLTKETSN